MALHAQRYPLPGPREGLVLPLAALPGLRPRHREAPGARPALAPHQAGSGQRPAVPSHGRGDEGAHRAHGGALPLPARAHSGHLRRRAPRGHLRGAPEVPRGAQARGCGAGAPRGLVRGPQAAGEGPAQHDDPGRAAQIPVLLHLARVRPGAARHARPVRRGHGAARHGRPRGGPGGDRRAGLQLGACGVAPGAARPPQALGGIPGQPGRARAPLPRRGARAPLPRGRVRRQFRQPGGAVYLLSHACARARGVAPALRVRGRIRPVLRLPGGLHRGGHPAPQP
mmetsp:Transcript_9012/g.30556  ORF Transcript_9012/g.30556 Transcript_9012/m.30556 type:complete len:283 (+) Transcript_9012:561-1409(+)